MALKLITAAADYPVTLEEAKAQCRVTSADEETKLQSLIAAATAHIEARTGRALMEQTWELVLDGFTDSILLPKGPVSAVSSVKYYDVDGFEQTVNAADYTVDLVSDPQWIVKASGASWPSTLDAVNAVTIRFVAGYDPLPEDLKHAVLLLVAHWFENREGDQQAPEWLDALLCNHRSFA